MSTLVHCNFHVYKTSYTGDKHSGWILTIKGTLMDEVLLFCSLSNRKKKKQTSKKTQQKTQTFAFSVTQS